MLQDCLGSRQKQTFPDIDYTCSGYNILKGYLLAIGNDPGFTYPIFETIVKRNSPETVDFLYPED